ncbi:unnamed protein product [Adineta ricciae]|uniref:Uncharacterized protein n=1 Tax=Adineta ricciae TaxID=249248 RepID=A0A814FYF3_ADIRI|nr:unnamed protein product [Adineta ricciae]CAF1425569.1 unnamed protein product [Adineta ricciae]
MPKTITTTSSLQTRSRRNTISILFWARRLKQRRVSSYNELLGSNILIPLKSVIEISRHVRVSRDELMYL